MANGDFFLVDAAVVPIIVDLCDFEGTFSGRREFGCFCVFILLLYNEYFVSNFVGMMDLSLVLFLVVGNSLSSALQFDELPVDFDVLPENHVHLKSELAQIVRQVRWAGDLDCPGASLNEMINIFMPVINRVD